uniref:Uncharacterized protein n=2 Tax=Anguilla anguilla TaxID=7936 RepID=A0A0E9V7U7_ANGAN
MFLGLNMKHLQSSFIQLHMPIKCNLKKKAKCS